MAIGALKIVPDRKKMSDAYDLVYFIQRHGRSRLDALQIVNLHRSDRDASDRVVERLKS